MERRFFFVLLATSSPELGVFTGAGFLAVCLPAIGGRPLLVVVLVAVSLLGGVRTTTGVLLFFVLFLAGAFGLLLLDDGLRRRTVLGFAWKSGLAGGDTSGEAETEMGRVTVKCGDGERRGGAWESRRRGGRA